MLVKSILALAILFGTVTTGLAVAYNIFEPKKEVYQWDKTFKIDTLLARIISQKSSYTSFLMPIEGEIINPFSYNMNGNKGINIKATEGSPVIASNEGVIALVSRREYQPTVIIIKHANNILSAYANITDVVLEKGHVVNRGQIIGKLAPGKNYLHFEVIKNHQRVDPVQFFE
ncbi:MAG: murein hydrolase activator EnvC family protein [Paracoccaceae bacterium]